MCREPSTHTYRPCAGTRPDIRPYPYRQPPTLPVPPTSDPPNSFTPGEFIRGRVLRYLIPLRSSDEIVRCHGSETNPTNRTHAPTPPNHVDSPSLNRRRVACLCLPFITCLCIPPIACLSRRFARVSAVGSHGSQPSVRTGLSRRFTRVSAVGSHGSQPSVRSLLMPSVQPDAISRQEAAHRRTTAAHTWQWVWSNCSHSSAHASHASAQIPARSA